MKRGDLVFGLAVGAISIRATDDPSPLTPYFRELEELHRQPSGPYMAPVLYPGGSREQYHSIEFC